MWQEGRLIGCVVHDENLYFWLNQRPGGPIPAEYNGISLYWTPADIYETRTHLKQLGYEVSDIEDRDYGQTEFFLTDDDGHSHCFGVATGKPELRNTYYYIRMFSMAGRFPTGTL